MTISSTDAIALLQSNLSAYTIPTALKALVAQLNIAAASK